MLLARKAKLSSLIESPSARLKLVPFAKSFRSRLCYSTLLASIEVQIPVILATVSGVRVCSGANTLNLGYGIWSPSVVAYVFNFNKRNIAWEHSQLCIPRREPRLGAAVVVCFSSKDRPQA